MTTTAAVIGGRKEEEYNNNNNNKSIVLFRAKNKHTYSGKEGPALYHMTFNLNITKSCAKALCGLFLWVDHSTSFQLVLRSELFMPSSSSSDNDDNISHDMICKSCMRRLSLI